MHFKILQDYQNSSFFLATVLVARYCIWIKPITIFNGANCGEGTNSATYWYLRWHNHLNKNWQATIPTSEGETLDIKYKLTIPLSRFKAWLHRIAFKFGPQNEEHATDHVYYMTLFWFKNIGRWYFIFTLLFTD